MWLYICLYVIIGIILRVIDCNRISFDNLRDIDIDDIFSSILMTCLTIVFWPMGIFIIVLDSFCNTYDNCRRKYKIIDKILRYKPFKKN